METTFMRRLRYKRRRAFIEGYAFPPALRSKLRDKLESDHDVDVALDGLRAWYLACLDAPGEMLGMPSRAVDLAWHEMILMTRAYHAFCEQAFGHYLHHKEDDIGRLRTFQPHRWADYSGSGFSGCVTGHAGVGCGSGGGCGGGGCGGGGG